MTRDTKVQLIAAITGLLSLAGSVVLSVQLTAIAGRQRMTYTDRAEDGQDPMVSLGVAMGAFRGLFVNWLWIRANDLKEAGKYWEAVQLADAITRLQPRFPRVWAFHAWNLAYNISVTTQTVDERWYWVNAGIDLLRARAIPANPNDMVLHKELSWIFLHKVAGYTDDANPHYKRRLAQEWTVVLGPPPPKDVRERSRQGAIDRYAAWLEAIAGAPDTLEQAIALEPSVGPLAQALSRIEDVALDDSLLIRYEIVQHVRRSGRSDLLEKGLVGRTRQVIELLDSPGYAQAWPILINHVRKRLLIDAYHMEPDRMVRYTRKYGPIDWRLGSAHALYWAARGVEKSLDRWNFENMQDFDFTNTDRQVAHSVQDLFRYGEVYFDFLAAVGGEQPVLVTAPNVHFVETYGEILEELRARSWADDRKKRAFTTYSQGYENFLRDAIAIYYRQRNFAEAQRWYDRLITDTQMNFHDRYRDLDLTVPLPEFVEREIADRYTSPNVAVGQVVSGLIGAYTTGLLGDDLEAFRGEFEFAKRVHTYYFREQARRTAVSADLSRMELMDRDFGIQAGTVFVQFLASLTMDDASLVYNRAPADLRNYAYPQVVERFQQRVEAEEKVGGKGFSVVFPKPQDHDQFRAWLEQELAKRMNNSAPIEQK